MFVFINYIHAVIDKIKLSILINKYVVANPIYKTKLDHIRLVMSQTEVSYDFQNGSH